MQDREYLFLQTSRSSGAEAEWLEKEFGLEPIPNGVDDPARVGLRGKARTRDGAVGYEVQPNTYPVSDPEPDEVQAIDAYPVQIAVWLGHDEGSQLAEGRQVFDEVVKARPDVPVLLCHTVDALVAAYLPGRGVHDFPPGTTIDAVDQELWRDWVSA